MPFEYKGVSITWLGHDAFKIKYANKIIYIDPYNLKKSEKDADTVLITHNHFDHLSPDDIKKVATDKTVFVAPYECKNELDKFKPNKKYYVNPGDEVEINGIKVKAVRAYNINKFRSPGQVFHPKEDNKVGYVLYLGEVSIYHAGDSDNIPEVKDLKPTIALLPVSGTYVMTKEEAVQALKDIKPKIAIPMHYGTIVGSEADAIYFKNNAPSEVEVHVLKPYE
jgi:L-ascorbate metabolism protein UlaG (beta-lactamase superfamily)